MHKYTFCFFVSVCLASASPRVIKGTVVDPSGARVAGAQVSVVNRLGVEAAVTAANGDFELKTAGGPDEKLVVTAPGFESWSRVEQELTSPLEVKLTLAPVVDAVRVAGSALDVPLSQQGGTVSIITPQELRERNEPLAVDLLRTTPGLIVAQSGPTGSLSGLYIRGGETKYNLVTIDGVPVNAFGGNFDFTQIPSEEVERVEVARGPQSAVYGLYANSGVVNFVTREPSPNLTLDAVAEGGSYSERRFALSGGGQIAGFGIAASATQMNTGGPVANSDYRNQNVMINVTRHIGRQYLKLHGDFDSNENGVPGAWGSDPAHTFTGIDLISRNKNNFQDYMARYEVDLSSRVRQEVSGAFFQNNNGFASAFPFTFNKDQRGQGDARTIVSVTRDYVAAFGFTGAMEELLNSYVMDANYAPFTVRRRDFALYTEHRFVVRQRLFINAGVRGESLRTGSLPPDGFVRPFVPAKTISSASPKIAAALALGRTRLHSSFATGIRPPDAFAISYTDNPALKPERTRSLDAGVEQRFGNWLSLDATYFHNNYHDLIVILGGSLAKLSRFQSDNLASSRAQGGEFSARIRPARWLFVEGSYTLLKTEILSLKGTTEAPPPFKVGQELLRRPKHFGALNASFHRGRVTGNVTGTFRGPTLDVEPALGATNGLFRNPGYADMGLNLNYELAYGLSVYGNLRNALNWHYEEALGYPSPWRNFVAGVKWSFSGLR